MTKVRIVTDSTCYLPDEAVRRYGISLVSLSVTEDGMTQRELDMDWPAFYDRLDKRPTLPTTSQPPPSEIVAAFEGAVVAGEQVCGVFLSSWMSGTFEGAMSARADVLERHPEAVIEVVDALTTGMVLGFVVERAALAAEGGADASACAQAASRWAACGRWLIAPLALENLRKGGRIGGAAAVIGSALKIMPLITVESGRVELLRRVRTRARLLDEMIALFADETSRLGLSDVCVQQIEAPDEAAVVAERIAAVTCTRPAIMAVGPVVGLHVGPATGLAYLTLEPIVGA